MITLKPDVEWYFVRDPEGFGLAVFDEGFYTPATFKIAIRNTLKQIGLTTPEHWTYDQEASDQEMMVIRFDEKHHAPIKMLLMSRLT